jgi:hypothetical protein
MALIHDGDLAQASAADRPDDAFPVGFCSTECGATSTVGKASIRRRVRTAVQTSRGGWGRDRAWALPEQAVSSVVPRQNWIGRRIAEACAEAAAQDGRWLLSSAPGGTPPHQFHCSQCSAEPHGRRGSRAGFRPTRPREHHQFFGGSGFGEGHQVGQTSMASSGTPRPSRSAARASATRRKNSG